MEREECYITHYFLFVSNFAIPRLVAQLAGQSSDACPEACFFLSFFFSLALSLTWLFFLIPCPNPFWSQVEFSLKQATHTHTHSLLLVPVCIFVVQAAKLEINQKKGREKRAEAQKKQEKSV